MKNLKYLFSTLLLGLIINIQAQTKSDSTAIACTVKDYLEGWFTGDATRVDKAVHPDLSQYKVHIHKDSGVSLLSSVTKSQLLEYTKAGFGKQTQPQNTVLHLDIYDIYANYATVKVSTPEFYDYIQLIKFNGNWEVLNVEGGDSNEKISQTQIESDSMAISNTIKNYIEGWYTGDVIRMDKALHPELNKHKVDMLKETGGSILSSVTRSEMHEFTKSGYGKSSPREKTTLSFQIFDISGDFATAKSSSLEFFDYIQLVRFNGEWVILNVEWDFLL